MSYILKELLAARGNYGGIRAASAIRYIVIHYTGNDGDTAANNAAYFRDNLVKASAHYFVDDTTVWRSVPELMTAWAVGGSLYPNASQTGGGRLYGVVTNANSLSIELCDTVRNGVYQASEATLANGAALCRELMEWYGIPLENVCRHFDVTGKHCPSYMVSAQKWAEFKKRLEVRDMDNTPKICPEAVAWARDQGILRGNASGDLMLSRPCSREEVLTFLWRALGCNG